MRTRRFLLIGSLNVLIVGIVVMIMRRRRSGASTRAAGRGQPVRRRFTMRVSTGHAPSLSLDAGEGKGFTVNERLFGAGAMPEFDAAVRERDREAMIAVLVRAGLPQPSATATSDTILANPQRYGY
jgi:hypothetical protein